MNVQELNGRWSLAQYPCLGGLPADLSALGEPIRRVAGTVPGDVHADLMAAGLLRDPMVAEQAKDAQWVTEYDWCYTREFEVTALERFTELEFDGLDTFAAVFLNGVKVGEAANMLIPHRFPVEDAVKVGHNTLSVYLRSVADVAAGLPTEGYGGCFNIQRLFMRKAQCQFGWDWAPYLPSVGIWQGVRLVSRTGHRIRSHRFETRLDGRVTLFFEIDARGALWSGDPQEQKLVLAATDTPASERTYGMRLSVTDGDTVHIYERTFKDYKDFFSFTVQSPRLWWPHDMGDQPLYDYTLTYVQDGVDSDTVTGRFAIRTVETNEEPREGEAGLKFQLRVNGEPVFLKGGNWVPLDCFPGTVGEDRYRRALTMAREANINAFRVWGGGIYEKDRFYDICDELGILIWQDFAFACADLPDDYPGLMDQIEEELETTVRRLANHPCIALWCGGNEHNGCFGYFPCKGLKQFHYLFRGIANSNDPSRPYVESSPFGYHFMGGISRSGDQHTASYNCGKLDWNYRRGRLPLSACGMATEIGTMGFPPLPSLRRYIPKEAQTVDSAVIDAHFVRNPYDASGKGFLEMEYDLACDHFGTPRDFGEFAKMSACAQTEYVKLDIAFHRSRKTNCSGALLWMYDDCWPCGTWSVIDYYLEPKAAYYAVKAACAPVAVCITRHKDGRGVWVVNDTRCPVTGTLTVGRMDVNGGVVCTRDMSVTVPAETSVKICPLEGEVAHNGFDFARFESEAGTSRSIWFPEEWHEIEWPQPDLSWKVVAADGCRLTVEFTAKKYARFVRIGGLGERVHYSDNYFDLLPGEVKQVTIETPAPADPAALEVAHWLDWHEDRL